MTGRPSWDIEFEPHEGKVRAHTARQGANKKTRSQMVSNGVASVQGTVRLCVAAVVEGLNSNAKLASRKARGFRTYEALETALYHQLGHLPEPHFAHRFC